MATTTRTEAREAARLRRVALACGNPRLFGELYVRPYDANWDAPLPQIAEDMLRFAMTTRRGVVITGPETMKTTTLSQLYPLWVTARYAAAGRLGQLAGLLLSEEQKLAQRNLGVLSWHIENNELLRADFVGIDGQPLMLPDPDEDKWTDQEIVVQRPGTAKDPTWQAKGLTAKGIQGARLSHMIGDDVITPRSAESPAERRKALHLWDTQITSRLVETGQALLAGNFNSPRDLVSTLAERSTYRVFRRPSLHVKGNPEVAPEDPRDPSAVVAVPEKWSHKRLMEELRDKPNRFRRIHLLDSKAESGERLRAEWLSRISANETPVREAKFYMGLDPAPGGDSDDTDFFNVTVGAAHGQHLDIVVCHDARIGTKEQCDLVAGYVDEFDRRGKGVAAIGVPKIALDSYFKGALEIHRPDLIGRIVPISGITTHSKEDRIEALGPFAASGWLRVWESVWNALTSDRADQDQELSLYEQWTDFPAINHDDKLDGIDVLQRTARQFAKRGEGKKKVKM